MIDVIKALLKAVVHNLLHTFFLATKGPFLKVVIHGHFCSEIFNNL